MTYEAPEELVHDFAIEVQKIGNHPDDLHDLVMELLDTITSECDGVDNYTYKRFMQSVHVTIGAVVATI